MIESRAIPQQRVIEKLDEYMSRRDYAGAERHLLYWLEEARAGGDLRGALMLRNALVGHYRKTGQRERRCRTPGGRSAWWNGWTWAKRSPPGRPA